MAVKNELVYIIRLTPEGEQEVVRANRVIDNTGKKVDQVDKNFGSYKKTLGATGKTTAKYSKQSAGASNALLDLTRIAQDAQYGIRGVANNLEQAAVSSGNAFKTFGSFKGLMAGLGSALTGPVGIVVGITAVTQVLQLAERGVFNFGEETKDFAEDSEQMITKLGEINDELAELKGLTSDSFFSTEADVDALRRFNVVEEDIKDRIRDLEKLSSETTDGIEFRALIRGSSVEEIQQVYGQSKEYIEWLKEQSSQLERKTTNYGSYFSLTDEQQEDLSQYQSDLEAVSGKIEETNQKIDRTKRLESYPTLQAAEKRRELEELNKTLEDTDKELSSLGSGDGVTVDTSFEDPENYDKELAAIDKRKMQRIQQQGRARMQFEKSLQQMRLNVAMGGADKLAAIEIEKQHKIDQIRNKELLSTRQQQEAITLIEQQYAQKREKIAEREAEKKNKLAQQEAEIRKAAQLSAVSDISSLLQSSFAQSKAVAVATGTANAVLAGINTAKKVSEYAPPPIPQIAGAAMAALQLRQVAKIKGTSIGGGSGSGGSNGRSIGYRGLNTGNERVQSPSANAGSTVGRPEVSASEGSIGSFKIREIRITDGLGKLVAKGQEEIDRKGGSNYLRGGA